MSAWFFDWIKAIQLKARYLFGIWFAGALILFSPISLADKMGITNFRQTHKHWIGLATIVAFVFWFISIWGIFHNYRKRQKREAAILEKVKFLSPEEKTILAYCVDRQQQSISLEITEKSASLLSQKGLLIKGSGVHDVLYWPHTIPDFLWSHLCTFKELIFGDLENQEAKQVLKRFENKLKRLSDW